MIKIYQLYYDQISRDACEPGFIPVMNTEPDVTKNNFYENKTILDIFFNESWQEADYVGCVSWQFRNKTGLGYDDIITRLDEYCQVYSLSPKQFNNWPHTYDRETINDKRMSCIPGITNFVDFVDNKRILPVSISTLQKYKRLPASYCNFWLLSNYCFREYITSYLLPVVSLFMNCRDTEWLNYKTKHGHADLSSLVFFLEGLFSVYLSTKYYKYIQ